jgi:hypothetical protein
MSVKARMFERSSHRDQLRESRQRRHVLAAEIATFVSPVDRADLRALFARYDDAITTELRDMLALQEAQAERTANRRCRPVGGL